MWPMAGALFTLQLLFIALFAVSYAMARFGRREVWFWLMGLSVVGIVVCAGLTYWGPLLGLSRSD